MDLLRVIIPELASGIIRRFDDWLSQHEHVEPFSDNPQCVLKIQVLPVSHTLDLPDVKVPKGEKVLILHLWNERMPPIHAQGPDLNYAVSLRRVMIASLKAVARYIQKELSLQNVQAVGGVTAHPGACLRDHITLGNPDGGSAMLHHLGFTLFPYYRPFGRFGEFWENFYTWWLMWTYNPTSTRGRSMFSLQRTEFWMSTTKFLEKYAG